MKTMHKHSPLTRGYVFRTMHVYVLRHTSDAYEAFDQLLAGRMYTAFRLP